MMSGIVTVLAPAANAETAAGTVSVKSVPAAVDGDTIVYSDGSRFTSSETKKSPNTVQSGQFGYTMEVACCLDSRQWTANGNGTTNVQVQSARDEVAGNPCSSMRITLFRSEWWGWSQVGGAQDSGCGPKSLYWGTSAGTYKFHAEPTRGGGGPYVYAYGTVYYP